MDWFEGHRHELTGLPRIGFRSKTVACFINQAECNIAFIDHLVKKPGSKDNVVDGFSCVQACIEWAKHNGIRLLFGFSSYPHIVGYSKLVGFKKDKHKYFYMELE